MYNSTLRATVDPLLTAQGDSQFSWSNALGVSVSPGAIIGPSGALNGARIQAVSNPNILAQYLEAPCDDPVYLIAAKQGSGPNTANWFGMYNAMRAENTTFGNVDYATGATTVHPISKGGTLTATADKNGYWLIVTRPPAGAVKAGEHIYVYAGFTGGSTPVGDFAYVCNARVMNPASLKSGFNLSRQEKFAIGGAVLAWLLRR